MFGVINMDKPLHLTSHDVVAKVRRKLGVRRVGHCGTLDPLASGVLPVCVGQATRLIEYFPSDKQYRAVITFGRTTLSWDAEGDWISDVSAAALTQQQVTAELSKLEGPIQQQVPPHAAVHVNGKKLYEYARKGITVELPIRPAIIYRMALVSFLGEGTDHPELTVDIHCASGTYVRSIAQALGQATGYGAYLSGLVRTHHGQFTLEQSISLDDFLDSPHPETYVMNPTPYLAIPSIVVTPQALGKLSNGMKLLQEEVVGTVQQNRTYVLISGDYPVGVASGEPSGRLKPLKVFPLG